MIQSFKHKGLKELFITGHTSKISLVLHKRILRRLDVLDQAKTLDDLKIPGFNFHKLEGKPSRFTFHVNRPCCLTFGWEDQHANLVDFEQYH